MIAILTDVEWSNSNGSENRGRLLLYNGKEPWRLLIINFKTRTTDYETDALLNVRQNRLFLHY
jgi:hypothetical protein